jgi:hypothetical protein
VRVGAIAVLSNVPRFIPLIVTTTRRIRGDVIINIESEKHSLVLISQWLSVSAIS